MSENALAQLLREHWAAQDQRMIEHGWKETIEGHGVSCVCEHCMLIIMAGGRSAQPSPPKHELYRLTAEVARLERRVKELERAAPKPHHPRQDRQQGASKEKAAPGHSRKPIDL